jgi:hypothetical protein
LVLSRAGQALLWSAVLFPGAGHLHLKYFKRGIALVSVTLLSLSLLLFQFVRLAVQVIESTLAHAITLDVPRLAALILQACAADTLLISALWVLTLCWLLGMLDAYRLGKKPHSE